MKKFVSYSVTAVFLAMIFGIGILNLRRMFPTVETFLQTDLSQVMQDSSKIEEDYREKFWKRRRWIDVYGGAQKLFNRRLIGNMEFVLMKNGLMDYVTKEADVAPFAAEMTELKTKLDEKQIPLLYVQMPAREAADPSIPKELMKVRQYYGQIREVTDKAGIICLDEAELLAGEDAPALEEIYFRTDIHTTTRGEIWMAGQLAKKLDKEFQIHIPDVIQYGDERFDVHSHPFLGNLAQSVGRYYNGVDVFEEYVPRQDTDYRISEINGSWQKEGSFQEVVMNGYDGLAEKELYRYWITNYLDYGTGGYHIENLDSEGPSLMVICDSLCYRTLSYLSLECRNITVIDPRFYPDDGSDLVSKALEERDYDAAIYLHGTFSTTKFSMFGRWRME